MGESNAATEAETGEDIAETAGADVAEDAGVDAAVGAASIGLDATGIGAVVGLALGAAALFGGSRAHS